MAMDTIRVVPALIVAATMRIGNANTTDRLSRRAGELPGRRLFCDAQRYQGDARSENERAGHQPNIIKSVPPLGFNKGANKNKKK